MKEIKIFRRVGSFAENKDLAREIRIKELFPYVNNEKELILNFEKVESTTQSFIHALISDIIREKGVSVLDRLYFKNCNVTIQKIINIVTEYMQDKS